MFYRRHVAMLLLEAPGSVAGPCSADRMSLCYCLRHLDRWRNHVLPNACHYVTAWGGTMFCRTNVTMLLLRHLGLWRDHVLLESCHYVTAWGTKISGGTMFCRTHATMLLLEATRSVAGPCSAGLMSLCYCLRYRGQWQDHVLIGSCHYMSTWGTKVSGGTMFSRTLVTPVGWTITNHYHYRIM
jgi:hypothetical protein